jgi:hypothetical protein
MNQYFLINNTKKNWEEVCDDLGLNKDLVVYFVEEMTSTSSCNILWNGKNDPLYNFI